jgi:hypothetical protein
MTKQIAPGARDQQRDGRHVTKPKATHIPAFIDPPPPPMPGVDDPGLLGEWIAFRDDMDDLEASLNVNRPDLD